jgi:hypothetical protein
MGAERPARLIAREKEPNLSFWIDEAIWGHRLHDEQTPWLVLLEMLGALYAEAEAGRAFREETLNRLRYPQAHRLALRHVLFNNPFVNVVRDQGVDSDARWSSWFEEMKKSSDRGSGAKENDFAYLRERFDSFEDFASVLDLIRSTAVEGDSNKRWTSKFVFPYGPSCLYEDLRLDDEGNASNDRRFFGRTGELAYLMLCRSGRGDELYRALSPLVLDPAASWNRLVERLQPGPETLRDPKGQKSPFLPYATLPDFDCLAGDMLALLNARLPGYDVLPHLVDLLGLHLMLYMLRRAVEWAPGSPPARLVLEIIAPRRTTVRDLAVESFRINDQLSQKAVEGYLDVEVRQSHEWCIACAESDEDERHLAAARVLRDKVMWDKAGEGAGEREPEEMLKALVEQARKRHGQHVSGVHANYAQAIGLASRRGTRKIRYAPSDQLLKSLVLAVVPRRMEFQEFLKELWRRYAFVIGHHQAADYLRLGESDQCAFEENERRLEMRLASLGLLRRLSDACAYVENPMGVER